MYCTTYESAAFGPITLASDGDNLVGLWLPGQKYYAATVVNEMKPKNDLTIFAQTAEWLDRYFAGKQPDPAELPLAPLGSNFRQRVWQKLLDIPYGQVRTYGSIAQELAAEDEKDRMSAQAVGGAVGHNPISIITPCHRVVGSTGSLTGYAGGVDKKVKLLQHEGTCMDGLFVPTKGTAL
ncbi:MAG: methylated-DNA--[protein]-cysteine S-methyltransferase [Coriobacteriia bacterium]|nr:methylated-DNA--[protein]-cysteine S-methyltransferase [Coriobacteriia bacterium]